MQESIEIAAGESRQLEAEFVLDSAVISAAQPLDWIVLTTESAGFARQALVRCEFVQYENIDADVRTASH